MKLSHRKSFREFRHVVPHVAVIVLILAMLMTAVIPDIDHHRGFSAGAGETALVLTAPPAGEANGVAGEGNHHCLLCPGSSQKLTVAHEPALAATALSARMVFAPKADHIPSLFDFHYCGQRSPPLV